MIAGSLTKTNQIGYLAAVRNSQGSRQVYSICIFIAKIALQHKLVLRLFAVRRYFSGVLGNLQFFLVISLIILATDTFFFGDEKSL